LVQAPDQDAEESPILSQALEAELEGVLRVVRSLILPGGGGSDAGGQRVALDVEDLVH
jgi:hypothetical protein